MNTQNLIIGLATVTIVLISIDLTRTLLRESRNDRRQRQRRRGGTAQARRHSTLSVR